MPKLTLTLNVNGTPVGGEVEPRTLLVQFLRENLGLTGTHIGCDTSQCGCCSVHLEGRVVKSCTVLAVQAQNATVTTIEGLAGADGRLHPMQQAFRDHHALQCGYCTPGMIMSAVALAGELPADASSADIRKGLEGNLCRCTGYHNIVEAIAAGLSAMRGG